MARSVEPPTSAQAMISRFVGSSPAWGSARTARSPEPASDSGSPSLSAPPLLVLSLCLSKMNKRFKNNIKKKCHRNIPFSDSGGDLACISPPRRATSSFEPRLPFCFHRQLLPPIQEPFEGSGE